MRKGLTLPADCRDIEFPREALRRQIREFELVYRLSINEAGVVEEVAFPESSLRSRAFERAARDALIRCRFEADGTRYVAIGAILFRVAGD